MLTLDTHFQWEVVEHQLCTRPLLVSGEGEEPVRLELSTLAFLHPPVKQHRALAQCTPRGAAPAPPSGSCLQWIVAPLCCIMAPASSAMLYRGLHTPGVCIHRGLGSPVLCNCILPLNSVELLHRALNTPRWGTA